NPRCTLDRVGAAKLPAGTFVVIPAHNEELMLGSVIDDVIGLYPDADVVVVDDGSSDRTHDVAATRGVHLLRHIVNLGQGAALRTGFDFALASGAAIIATFDADGQMDARDLPDLVDPVA